MADEKRVGVFILFVVTALGILCCALPALLAVGVLAAAGGRWWLAIGIFLLALAGWVWHRQSRSR